MPFPAFGNYLNFVSPPHRRAYTSIPKLCPNIRFPHQQDFFPIKSVTKSSTARFSHENLVEKIKILVQDLVPIRTALTGKKSCWANLMFGHDFGILVYALQCGGDTKFKLPKAGNNSQLCELRIDYLIEDG